MGLIDAKVRSPRDQNFSTLNDFRLLGRSTSGPFCHLHRQSMHFGLQDHLHRLYLALLRRTMTYHAYLRSHNYEECLAVMNVLGREPMKTSYGKGPKNENG